MPGKRGKCEPEREAVEGGSGQWAVCKWLPEREAVEGGSGQWAVCKWLPEREAVERGSGQWVVCSFQLVGHFVKFIIPP